MPTSLTVRPATPDQAEAVAALANSAYRGEESRHGWTTEESLVGGQRADAAMVRGLMEQPDSVVLIGLDTHGLETHGLGQHAPDTHGPDAAARLLACCHLERRGGSGYLGMFAVRPRLQGQGTGRAMLDAAETYARDTWDARSIELTVLDQRPELIAWYERCGFRLTGERHEFPDDDERFGVPQRPDLELLAMARPVGRRRT
ncbi:GNAT family N-acetyltransferase [Cellulomonas fimi]|uniref:GNAT family N-acetyltransferase n=1 Tax=Cellulomonas fimi TaxID=1708 RepID=A0A7Y0LXP4_CELFI|nr:GNAT family N-acetyltransferase [Cellulomonas fimi]NMR18652.1 GNAT family N-acetyltransferase [Cellulomonas fimi]